jgi:hypothetical protein
MQEKVDMPAFYAAADICLVPLKRRDVFLFNIPSKMFEIMACGSAHDRRRARPGP